ncbi:MarR family winged helix-turn-helix transcriptional regulator [Gemella cuniculi]|uniref:MarR family winged helix-turn-helix transcriptional regulator n=1 Tax=Gemella cuniculi TaxID=150240 RepID=UPI0003F59372|nr:MarR family transcriptional regulator [Gemella cuniculi]
MNINSIAVLVKIASLEFDKVSNPVLLEYDLTPSQYRVLKFLYSQQPKLSRVVDIEKKCAITHPTALGLLDNLEKKGFVFKVSNPKDARSKVISLTEKAKDMKLELVGVGDRIENMLTENLSSRERKLLLKYLQKLLKIQDDKDLTD